MAQGSREEAVFPHVERFRSAHYTILERDGYVVLERTSMPLNLSDDLVAAHAPMLRVLNRYRAGGLVVDLRRAAPRLEPNLQRDMAGIRQAMIAGQARTAVLVATQVGKLEVQRHHRDDGTPPSVRVFTDEADARAHAQGPRAAGLSFPPAPH
ncbi:MAG: hypothetical protein AAF645_05110 [Myxococcota bacterium]